MTPAVLAGGGAALLAGCVLALVYPRIALLLLVTLDVSNINGVLAEHLGSSPYLPQLILAIVALAVMVRRRMFRFSWSPVLLGVLVLFTGFCLSFIQAADPVTSESLLLARGRDLVYFVVVYALVLSTNQVRSVVNAAVLVLAGLAALTVFHEFVLHNSGTLWGLSEVPLTQEGGALTPRHAGTSADVNFWARLLILFTPLSLSLLAVSRSARPRLLWAACTMALLVGVYLTQSRGGFIALFVALVVWAVLAGGRYRKALLWVPLGLLVLVPLTGIGSRLATLAAIGAASTSNADESVVTRERFQIDAWHMFQDSPLTGHGIGSYGTLFRSYDRLSNFYNPVTIVVAAHNFYLEQAADGGVLLLLAWGLFMGIVGFVALRTITIARRIGNDRSRFVALGIVGGIVGWLVASIFLHLSDFRSLLLVAAIAAALDVKTRAELRNLDEAHEVSEPQNSRALLRTLVAVGSMALIGLIVILVTGGQRYSTAVTLAVAPSSGAVDPTEAYQVDLISRGLIAPTMAEVLNHSMSVGDLEKQAGLKFDGSDPIISVALSRLGGSVVVTVSADDQQAVGALGDAVVPTSQTIVAALESGYQLTGSPSVVEPISSYRLWAAGALAAIAGFSAIAGVRLVRRRPVSGEKPVGQLVSAE